MVAATVTLSGKHDSLREGARLGLAVATSIWIWLAVVDAVVGEPFRTFTVLGGVALFTAMHYLLNVVYGAVIVAAIHGAAREPSLVMAVAFGFPIVEFVFALVTVLLSHLGLGGARLGPNLWRESDRYGNRDRHPRSTASAGGRGAAS